MKSLKDPKSLERNLSMSFKLLEKDLIREKTNPDRSIFPIDFSEIYSYLFPEFTQSSSNKISRLLLKSKNANIQYGLLPPTLAEFFLHLYQINTKIEVYQNLEKKINIGSQDVSNYVKKMSPGFSSDRPVKLNQIDDLIHTIITLSDQKIVEKSIINPCANFNELITVLKNNKNLLTFSEIFHSNEEKAAFIENSDDFVYKNVLSYLNSNDGRNPSKNSKMADNNRIDALLAHQSYILNEYYYNENSEYFSIFTSSTIPISALEQEKLVFPRKPFNSTPLFRDPLYLFCREAYLENISDPEELIKITNMSSDILENMENQNFLQLTKYSDKNNLHSFKAVYTLLSCVINNETSQNGLKEMMIDTLIQRYSRQKTEELISTPQDIDLYSIIHNLDDYINIEKQDYEEKFYKTQEILIENLHKLYLQFYPIIEGSDFWAISPKMMEMKKKIKFG
jgi:hypothetical protein